MKLLMLPRLGVAALLSVALAFAILPAGGVSTPVFAQVPAGANINACGTVSSYTAATGLLPGLVVVGGVPIPIAPGATLSGAGLLTSGSNVCVTGTANATGQLSSGTVTANGGAGVTTSVNVCGTVTAYTAATSTTPGSITIGGQAVPIAAGAVLSGAGLITSGANLCLQGTAGATGLVSGTVSPNGVSTGGGATTTTQVNVCGQVTAYSAATASAPGSVTIGGQTVPIAAGATVSGSNLLTSGSNVCLQGTSGTSGLINGTVSPNGVSAGGGATNQTSISVCGVVSGYNAATASSPGSVTIGSQNIPIAAGAVLSGTGLLTSGANVCLQGTSSTNGLVNGTVTPGGATVTGGAGNSTQITLCGVVSAYAPATANAPGSVTIGGQTIPIAAGTTLTGTGLLASGANVCVSGTSTTSGLASGSVTPNGVSVGGGATNTTSVSVCGTVTGYFSSTANGPGQIVIGGQTLPIAAGASLSGTGLITSGANLCLQGMSTNGALVSGTLTPNGASASGGATSQTTLNICGTVTGYTAATANAPGSVTIGSQTIPIAAGAALNGAGLLVSGASVCLQGTSTTSGLVSGTVTPGGASASGGATNTTSISLCGVVSAYTAATSSVPGSVTIGGVTVPIAAGTDVVGSGVLAVGSNFCLQGTSSSSGLVSGTVTPQGANVGASAANITSITVCGPITALTAASGSAPGSITIGGITFPIMAGTTLSSVAAVGSNLCGTLAVSGTPSVPGGITSASFFAPPVGTSASFTGPYTNYVAPTATKAGSITIGGVVYTIAAGPPLAVYSGLPLAATPAGDSHLGPGLERPS